LTGAAVAGALNLRALSLVYLARSGKVPINEVCLLIRIPYLAHSVLERLQNT